MVEGNNRAFSLIVLLFVLKPVNILIFLGSMEYGSIVRGRVLQFRGISFTL